MKKNIFITGGSGFLGKHVLDKIKDKDCNVTTLIRKKQKNNSLNYINYLVGDLLNKNFLKKKLNNIDIVMHLACDTNINNSLNNPVEMLNNNSKMLINILEECRMSGIKPLIVYASTDRVYGAVAKGMVDEFEPTHPIEPYTASKMYGEILLELYHRLYQIPYIIFRIDSIYGPGQPKRMFVSDVIQKMIKQDEIKVGNLRVKKNFVYVGDVVSAFLSVINTYKENYNTVYNIGGESLSLNSLLLEIKKNIENKLNKNIKVKHDEGFIRSKSTEVKVFNLSVKKINKALNWKTKVSIKDGLNYTVDYFLNL